MKRKAVSYIRFSTRKQIDGQSLQRQTKAARQFCEKHNLQLDTALSYQDLARSGHHGKRVGLKQLIEAINAGLIEAGSVVVIEALDRLSREKLHTAKKHVYAILEAGVSLGITDEDKIYGPESLNDLGADLYLAVRIQEAHSSSDRRSKLQRDNYADIRAKGEKHPLPPAWIKHTKTGKGKQSYELDEKKAAIVKRIFAMSAEGYGDYQIVKTFVREKVPTITLGRRSNCHGWNLAYIKKIICNRACLGEYTPHTLDENRQRQPCGPMIPDYYPAVVTLRQWNKTHDARKARYKKRGPDGKGVACLFTGLWHDARTRRPMRLIKASPGECLLGHTRRIAPAIIDDTQHPTWRYADFEQAFLQFVKEVDLTEARPVKEAKQVEKLETELAKLTDRINQIQTKLAGAENFPALLEALEQLDRQRAVVKRKLEGVKRDERAKPTEALQQARNLVDTMNIGTEAEREDVRARIRGSIALAVKEIWLLVSRDNIEGFGTLNSLTCQVCFRNGTVRYFALFRKPKQEQRAVFNAVADPDSHLATDFDLRNFPDTRPLGLNRNLSAQWTAERVREWNLRYEKKPRKTK